MFADWTGVLSKLYMSSAALVTGWVGAMLWQKAFTACRKDKNADVQLQSISIVACQHA
jgi:hypothetical protein